MADIWKRMEITARKGKKWEYENNNEDAGSKTM